MQPSINIEDTLNSEHVQGLMLKLLLKILLLTSQISKNKLIIVLNVLIMASVENKTINRICKDREVPRTGVTIRNTLKLIFVDMETLEKTINKLLRATINKKMRRTSPIISIDVILIGYYGKEEQDPREIKKGEKRNGTNSFHGYATAYVNMKGERYTLAIIYVWADDSMLEVIQRLNRHLRRMNIKPSLWLLDRGFFSVDVIQWFIHYKKPFIMLGKWTGRKPDHQKGPTGTRVYKTCSKSGWDRYTFTKGRRGKSITTDIAIVVTYPDGPGKYKNIKVRYYVSYGLSRKKARNLYSIYKKRFAIESSYRQMNQARARTASRSPVLRYLAVGISFVIRNLWISLHFSLLYETRRGPGGRKICPEKLPFVTMISWIRESLTLIFPLITNVVTNHNMNLLELRI